VAREGTTDSDNHRDLNRVIRWFISIRWAASVSVPLTLLVAQRAFGMPLAYRPLYITAIALATLNLVYTILYWKLPEGHWSHSRYTAFFHTQILADYVLLFLLVYFSGFLENPFTYFFVFHVLLTSFIFRPAIVWKYVVGLIVVIAGVALAQYLEFVPHYQFSGEIASLSATHMFLRGVGLCGTIAISAYLITSIRTRLEEKGRAVEIELNRYKNLDRIKSNFILQVTHELRGPIAAVSGFHDMVLRGITGEVNSKTTTALEKAERRTSNLLTIIDEMIDYAYMRSDDELKYQLTRLDMERVIREIVEVHASHAELRHITIRPECQVGLVLVSNRDLLNILLGNLLNNAIKYSPEHTTITVVARKEGSEVLLQVRDQGYGIDADQLQQIFEEFYRTRKARELERDGTGLGLPIVKRAVESMGGRIRVYSEVGRGTRFDIRLPVTGAASHTTKAHGETDEEDSDH
jgi:signal transduction histidine kinase